MTLLRKAEVAARLKVSPRTVERLRARGELPALRLGRRVRFKEEDVETYIDARRLYKPQSDPVVDGADFANGYTALVPAERPADGTLWSCQESDCGVREVVIKGRASASAPRCPACRGRLLLVGHLAELLLLPVQAGGG
jgi:excisionase family DNA binding protein